MVINTTDGPRDVPREARHTQAHTLNTSRVLEEDLAYEDEEPEIAFVLPAGAWHAEFSDAGPVPLVCWVVLDNGEMYGVAGDRWGEDGAISLEEGVGERRGFVGYIRERSNNDG